MYGLGRHMHTLTRPAQSKLITVSPLHPPIVPHLTFQAVLITSFGYHFVLMILKAAFLLQYRRSFPLPGFQRLCDIFLIFLLCWTIAGAIAGGSTCKPGAAAAGIVEASDKTCEEGFKVWLAHGVINIITDVLIYIMPLPLIRTLPLSKGQKIALFSVFSLGFLQVFSLKVLQAAQLTRE